MAGDILAHQAEVDTSLTDKLDYLFAHVEDQLRENKGEPVYLPKIQDDDALSIIRTDNGFQFSGVSQGFVVEEELRCVHYRPDAGLSVALQRFEAPGTNHNRIHGFEVVIPLIRENLRLHNRDLPMDTIALRIRQYETPRGQTYSFEIAIDLLHLLSRVKAMRQLTLYPRAEFYLAENIHGDTVIDVPEGQGKLKFHGSKSDVEEVIDYILWMLS